MQEADGSIQKLVLTRADLKQLGINISNTTLLRWERLDRFPRRLRLAGTTVRWLSSDIHEWLKKLDDARSSHVYVEY